MALREAIATLRHDAAPPARYFDHFVTAGYKANDSGSGGKFVETENAGEWFVSVNDQTGPANAEVIKVADDLTGGWLTVTNNAADNDYVNCQLNGESFKLDRDILFDTTIKITDVSETDWFIGLAISDADILDACTDLIGFRCPDSTGDIDYVAGINSTETTADTGSNLSDGTAVRLSFFYDHSESMVKFYVDGVEVGKVTTNLPNDEVLSPAFQVRNDGAVAQTMQIDYILVDPVS